MKLEDLTFPIPIETARALFVSLRDSLIYASQSSSEEELRTIVNRAIVKVSPWAERAERQYKRVKPFIEIDRLTFDALMHGVNVQRRKIDEKGGKE